jgi:hypothetical protein
LPNKTTVFWAKCVLGSLFIKVKCTFFDQKKKEEEKTFSSHRRISVYGAKNSKMQVIALPKFYARYLVVKITGP